MKHSSMKAVAWPSAVWRNAAVIVGGSRAATINTAKAFCCDDSVLVATPHTHNSRPRNRVSSGVAAV